MFEDVQQPLAALRGKPEVNGVLLRLAGRALALLTVALMAFSQPALADEEYLDPEVAFKFSAKMADPKTVEVYYAIADGYYM